MDFVHRSLIVYINELKCSRGENRWKQLRKRGSEEVNEAYRKYRYRLNDIAEYLGYYSTASRLLKKLEWEMQQCKT